ncbi:MAG: hypothetical protein VX944_17160 [Myxococcota bacterium]|nr:hypothetical protein [Myxococcota bacterium]
MSRRQSSNKVRLAMLLTAALGMSLASPVAEAKRKRARAIQMTGIQSFDAVFKKARTTNKRLRSAEQNLRASKVALRQSLKLSKQSTYVQGLRELKRRANGKLRVVMVGGTPRLRAMDAVPTEIQRSIEAVNALTVRIPDTVRDLRAVSRSSKQMYNQSRKFPRNIQRELSRKGVDGLWSIVVRSPRIAKRTHKNLKVIGGMPKRAARVSGDLADISSSLVNTFR